MKAKIIIGLICLLFLMVGCVSTYERCKDIAVKQSDSYRDLGYNEGLDKGIDIAEREIKSMRERYTPPEGCMILLMGNHVMNYICEGDDYYEVLK